MDDNFDFWLGVFLCALVVGLALWLVDANNPSELCFERGFMGWTKYDGFKLGFTDYEWDNVDIYHCTRRVGDEAEVRSVRWVAEHCNGQGQCTIKEDDTDEDGIGATREAGRVDGADAAGP